MNASLQINILHITLLYDSQQVVVHIVRHLQEETHVDKDIPRSSISRFTQRGCFVEDPSKGFKLIAKVKKEGRMFTMDVDSSNPHKFCSTYDNKKIAKIDLWHKRIGHVNICT